MVSGSHSIMTAVLASFATYAGSPPSGEVWPPEYMVTSETFR